MAVHATTRPDIIRVSIPGPQPMEATSESEIVCFMRLRGERFEINYSHHLMRSRQDKGAHKNETKYRFPLDGTLTALIQNGCMMAFWEVFQMTVRTMPAEIDTPVEVVEF